MKQIASVLLIFVLLASCSARIDGVLREGGSADLTIQANLEPRMTALIRSLKAMMGNPGQDDLILDGPSISRSMEASPGISSVSLVNTGPAALDGRIAISRVEDFLSPVKEKRFITYWEGLSTGRVSGRILISLDRETAPELIALLSAEAVDYLSALMAPAVLGEDISKDEYLMLITSLYGAAIAQEIRSARILASIDFPGSITAIQGGIALANPNTRAEFELPLLDLLVLEHPISWEISWQK